MPLFAANSICALLGSIVTFAFGGWQESLTLLLVAMGIDYVSGVAASIKEGKGLSSVFGFWGLTRKGLALLIILLTHRVDVLMGSGDMAMGAAIYFYTSNEFISIVENYGRIGLPLPDVIREVITSLKKSK
ncbi:phage holin family protein [Paenibacillus beijingensis]|uniref:Holin n=1 Tax=Paenibacillus beijingensis TaxID=1126833 RepID=A0A0D5NDE3_9BACL|nr:phage holin family protein [Paenibacillus beijingensis]AJY73419.1 holin [Paenibacillus beijingensis]